MKRGGASPTGGLARRRVVVTRAPHQAAELADLLIAKGALPLNYPCIDIKLPESTTILDQALRAAAAGHFDWLVITSANVAWALAGRAEALDIDLSRQRTAASGSSTAQVAKEKLRIDVELVPTEYRAEALVAALPLRQGQRVLLPQSHIARPALVEGLKAKGAEVTSVEAYRTVIGRGGEDVPAALAAGRVDAITFTSSSTVKNFLRRLETAGGDRAHLEGVCLAAIGPLTAGTMEEAGLALDLMPVNYTLTALVESLETYYLNMAPSIRASANLTRGR